MVTLVVQLLILVAVGAYLYWQARRYGDKDLRLGLRRYLDLSCEAPEDKNQRLKAALTEVLEAAANADLIGLPNRKIESLQVVLKDSGQVRIDARLDDGNTAGLVSPSIEEFVEALIERR